VTLDCSGVYCAEIWALIDKQIFQAKKKQLIAAFFYG
jgi:hypothetical protein